MRRAHLPLLAFVWGCWGAGAVGAQDAPLPPSEPRAEQPPSGSVLQSLKDFGAFGANMGGMLFVGDPDASGGALIRPSLQGSFRYRFSDDWVGVGDFGFGWNAYDGKGDTVLAVTSGSLGVYRRLSRALGLDWRMGAGAGLYRWNYKFEGKSVRDPETQLRYQSIDPGVFVGCEVERRLTAYVTLLATGQFHYLLSANEDDFPSMHGGGNDAFVAMRVGVSYHFSPYQGILWERKIDRTIKLKSGRAGL